MFCFVFNPKLIESEVQPFVVLKLLVYDFPVGERFGCLRRRSWEQKSFKGLVGEVRWEGPPHPGPIGSTENKANGVAGDAETLGDGAVSELAFEFQTKDISNVTHGTPRIWHTTSSS